MLWALVWTVLAVATLVGAAFLARWLWRKGLALARAVGAAGEAVAAAGDDGTARADELARLHPVPAPALTTDPAELAARLVAVRDERARRRDARAARHRLSYERWRQVWH